jgi:hypothetical protein
MSKWRKWKNEHVDESTGRAPVMGIESDRFLGSSMHETAHEPCRTGYASIFICLIFGDCFEENTKALVKGKIFEARNYERWIVRVWTYNESTIQKRR